METWKKYKEFRTKTMHPDDVAIVWVSSMGNVKQSSFRVAYARHGEGKYRRYKEKMLTVFDRGNGYMSVTINRKIELVHRMVAEAFIENHEGKLTVNHKDGVKSNNNVLNLEWATYKENICHAYSTGLNHRGENHKSSILTNDQVKKIKMRLKCRYHGCIVDIAKCFGVSTSAIKNIAYGNSWREYD